MLSLPHPLVLRHAFHCIWWPSAASVSVLTRRDPARGATGACAPGDRGRSQGLCRSAGQPSHAVPTAAGEAVTLYSSFAHFETAFARSFVYRQVDVPERSRTERDRADAPLLLHLLHAFRKMTSYILRSCVHEDKICYVTRSRTAFENTRMISLLGKVTRDSEREGRRAPGLSNCSAPCASAATRPGPGCAGSARRGAGRRTQPDARHRSPTHGGAWRWRCWPDRHCLLR